ncbi:MULTISPECIES: flagellar hook-basal body complex protein FliE [unclassified Pseudoxanthomonas]|jgi:flagellar hook-basal body complex protein FliE|uniref:flagellar hook-basal body complex protein FliE n=1 Tax=unclassified Pseudoxanthomonas TaxID=2645906 RepID=UPI003077817D
MSDSVSSILSQIRSYQNQLGTRAPEFVRSEPVQNPGAIDFGQSAAVKAPSFGETLQNAIQGVNTTQKEAGALAQAFELGDPRADLARVMVAAQQSQVAFRATVEVRNRLVQAYQDVMNMPL